MSRNLFGSLERISVVVSKIESAYEGGLLSEEDALELMGIANVALDLAEIEIEKR